MLKREEQKRGRRRITRATTTSWGKTFVSLLLVVTLSTMSFSPAIAEPAATPSNATEANVAVAADQTNETVTESAAEAPADDQSPATTEEQASQPEESPESAPSGSASSADGNAGQSSSSASSSSSTGASSSSASASASSASASSSAQDEKTISRTLSSTSGGRYTVTVKYGASTGIPDGSTIDIVEYTQEPSDPNWRNDPAYANRPLATERFVGKDYLAQRTTVAAKGLGAQDTDYVYFAKFLNVAIVNGGKEVAPKTAVEVTVETNALDVSCSDGLGLARMVYDESLAGSEQALKDGRISSDGRVSKSLDSKNATYDKDAKTNRSAADDKVVKLQCSTKELGEVALVGIAVPRATVWQDDGAMAQVLGPASQGAYAYEIDADGLAEGQELLGAYAFGTSPARDYGTTLWARVVAPDGKSAATSKAGAGAFVGSQVQGGALVGGPTLLGSTEKAIAFKAADGVAFLREAVTSSAASAVSATSRSVDSPGFINEDGVLQRRFPASTGGTYIVRLEYGPESGVPQGATLQVRELQGAEYQENRVRALNELDADSITSVRALDIAIIGPNGNRVEPAGDVSASITLENAVVSGTPQIVHIADGSAEVIVPDQTITPAGQGSVYGSRTLEFTTDGFSVYVIAYSAEDAGSPQCTYKFHVWSDDINDYTDYSFTDDTGRTVSSQIVKSTDELVVPQPPSTEEKEFAGWYAGTIDGSGSVVLEAQPYDFKNAQITEKSAIDLYAVYKDCVYVVFHDQYDASSNSYPIAYTRKGELVTEEGSAAATVKISDLSVAYNGDDDVNRAFFGWSYTPIATPGADIDDNRNPVSKITPDENGCITVTETTHLYPMFKKINWLTYYAAQSGLSASYIAPAYYFEGDAVPAPLPTTARAGYTFQGWWTGSLSSTTEGDKTVETVSYGKQVTDANGNLVEAVYDGGASIAGGELRLLNDVTLYAKWGATYNVVTWKQATTDADGLESDQKSYEYAETFTYPANIGDTAVVPADFKTSSKYDGYSFNNDKSQLSATIGNAKNVTVLNVYYDRTGSYTPTTDSGHTLAFVDSVSGTEASPMPEAVSNIGYGKKLASNIPADPTSDRKSSTGKDVYTFAGWFMDQACTIQADLGTMTMPDRDLTVYAGWTPIKFRVDIDPNYGALQHYENGELVGTGATYFSNTYADEPIAEYTYVTRDYVESSSGSHFYVNHDRAYNGANRYTYYTENPGEATEDTTFEYSPGVYSYADWYEVLLDANGNEIGEAESPYDFSQLTDHDTKLRLHWKKAGVYYLAYAAGGGALSDSTGGSEKEVVLPDGYSDYSGITLTRSANAPSGYAFVGWKVRGSESNLVYAPGQVFTLRADDAARSGGKDIVYLDAVYVKAGTASVVYNANGGTVNESAVDFGRIPGATSESTAATGVVDVTAGTATVSGLVNNARFTLSSGNGFSYIKDGVTFELKGWSNKPVYDPNDEDAELYTLGGTYGVDKEEPTTLYAVWSTSVTYRLNTESSTASWGGEWGSPYTYDSANKAYSQDVYLGNVVSTPPMTPTDSAVGSLFRYWATGVESGSAAYDFSKPVTGKLDLYANWGAASTMGVHAVDASTATLADKASESGWTANNITVTAEETALPGTGYVTAPEGYEFAFVALHDSTKGLSAITEAEAVTAVKYDSAQQGVCVKYAGADSFTPIGSNDALYYVYYQKKSLNIGYASMDQSGALTNVSMKSEAPTTTGETLLGTYDMQAGITAPLASQSSSTDTYPHYAYAIGSASATSANDLHFITDPSSSDDQRPSLQVKNTWRGFAYSTDQGASWVSCGYEPKLYVVYYEQRPTVIMFQESTMGVDSVMDTAFAYNLKVTKPDGSGGTTTVFDTTASGNGPYTLHNGEAQSAIVFYEAGKAQTIEITQVANNDFSTAVSSTAGTATQPYTWAYTADGTAGTQTVTFTNTHKSLPVEVHVAQIANDGTAGGIVCNDDVRSKTESSYKFDLGFGASETLTSKLAPSAVYNDATGIYAFGAVISGTGDSGQPVAVSSMDVAAVAYEQVDGGDAYALVLKDADGNQLGELGSNKLYYLYYPQPVIRYMKLGADGKTLTPITGSVINSQTKQVEASNDITYNHAGLQMNGVTVVQNQKFGIPLHDFAISQEGNNFRMPPILDDGLLERYLGYTMIGAGGINAERTEALDVSYGLAMQLTVQGNTLQYSFDGSTWKNLSLSDTPTIYAIYAERGYDLQIGKTVDMSKSGNDPLFADKTFTVTLSSMAITKSSYEAEGAEEATVSATPATETVPGTIVLTVQDGTKVRIKSLGQGDYTIKEEGNDNYNLSAAEGPIVGSATSAATIDENGVVHFALDSEKKVDLTNSPKAICKIGDVEFYTLGSAIKYAEEGVSHEATIEMLTDYLMPIEDVATIPSGLDITLTTAEQGFNGSGSLAVITRSDALKDSPLIVNNGSLTIANMTLEGGSIAATQPMIQSAGDLTIGSSAVVQNAINSGNGGAIYATVGNITVSDGALKNNSAPAGGAIYHAGNGAVSVSGTATIQNNVASAGDGGAIYATSGTIDVEGTAKLSGNTAQSGKGGAIYAGSAALSIGQNAGLENNKAKSGGAAYIESGSIEVTATAGVNPPSITGNQALDGDGGAFWLGAGSVTVSGGNVANNSATVNGGAICTDKASVTVSGTAEVKNNSAPAGGAISANSGAVTVSGGSVQGNSATTGNGGAILANSGVVTLSGGNIQGNSATAGSGGAVYAGSGNVILSSTASVVENTAKQDGGAVYADRGNVTVSCESLNKNKATDGNGGAVYAGSGTVAFVSVTASENAAGGNGGVVYANTGAVSIVNGSMQQNTAASNGGAVYANSGNVTLSGTSGASMTQNSAGANGGALYAGSGTVSLSNTTSMLLNSATAGNGGAVYMGSGSATFTGPTMRQNEAVNGSAVFVNSGKATFSGGTYTANTSSQGGAVGVGGTSARLSFTQDVQIAGNTLGTGIGAPKSNVYLDQDSDDVLSMTGLGSNASIGIYVSDSQTNTRGIPGARFASYTSDANVGKISNDRYDFNVQTDTVTKKLYWGKSIAVEVRYLESFAGGFPPTVTGTSKYTNNEYYPECGSAAISVLAEELFNKYDLKLTTTAAYGTAFAEGATAYGDYATNLVWNSTEAKWQLVKRNGATEDLGNRKIIIYYAEPAYISIENNTEMPLEISSLTVGGQSVVNTNDVAGYGTVFAKNGSIRTSLLPVGEADLQLAARASINLLIPGGRGMEYVLDGKFTTESGDSIRLRRTGMSEESLTADQARTGFELKGSTLTGQGTYQIIFGDDRAICKVVKDGVEHPFSKIHDAIQFAVTEGLTTATVEMLEDYLLPASDEVNIPQGYDITLTTAAKSGVTYKYAGDGDRATISRDSENMGSMVNAWNNAVSGAAATTLRLSNLVFDGKSVRGSSDGGAVRTRYTNVYVNNVDFNNVYGGNGGALYVVHETGSSVRTIPGTVIEVSNSNFTGCNSTKSSGDRLGGGAIHTNAETMRIRNCTFTSCSATHQAGAVFHRVDGSYDSFAEITGCTFSDCRAQAAGGLELDSKNITVSNCTFEHCVATQRNGGAFNVYALNKAEPTEDCWVTVTGCAFNDCQLPSATNTNGYGGGFRSTATYNTVNDCTFTNCSAVYGGGFSASNGNTKKTEINGCSFDDCRASNTGGGVYTKALEVVIGDYNGRHTTVENCSSNNEGGGIYQTRDANGSSLSITNALISGNYTKNNNKAGGGVYSNARVMTVSGTTISNNTATGSGGGMYANARTSLTISDSKVTKNTATTGDGGGIWFDFNNNDVRNSMVLGVYGCEFEGNTAGANGGGIYTLAKTATIGDSNASGAAVHTSISNCSGKNGGGFYQSRNTGGSILTISNATISGCRAAVEHGGGVYASVRTLNVSDSDISGNSSTQNGGGIFFEINDDNARNGMVLTVSGCTLDADTAGQQGGGIFTRALSTTIKPSGSAPSTISNCIAAYSGGGVWSGRNADGSLLKVEGSSITGCVANDPSSDKNEHGGGGIYTWCRTVEITGSTVQGNSAAQNGGGILSLSSDYDRHLVIDGSSVGGNTAGNKGGGVYSKSQVTIRNDSVVTGNRLSISTAGNAAGMYLENNRTLTVGVEGSESYDASSIKENYTSVGTSSNLRLWSDGNGENNKASVYVYGNLNGEIRVVNAAKAGTWFGSSAISKPDGFADDAPVFKADGSTLHGIIDRTDESGTKIIWAGPPIAKITGKDENGNDILLYLKANGSDPAIFDRLDTGNGGAYNTLAAFNVLKTAEPKLYTKEGELYIGSSYSVKMLDSFETSADITLNYFAGRNVTFTTAGVGDTDGYPFVGTGTRATVVRGSGVSSNRTLFNVMGNLLLENIVIDGGSENGVTPGGSTRCLWVDNDNCTVVLGANAMLQNGNTTGNGGGAYIQRGTFEIRGSGIIRNCSAASGGAVYINSGKTHTMEAGNIYQCRATGNGGGIYLNSGTLNMTGGTISGGHAAEGGGVYIANGRPLYMSGGSIVNNSATTKGGGIAIGGGNSRLYFSGKVSVSGNTAVKDGGTVACNLELNQNSKAVINTNNGGLLPGSYIGVYVPGVMDEDHPENETDPYKTRGGEKDAFGTFAAGDNTINLYSFVNDRNGLKGGIIENPDPNTIYWIQIFSLQVSKVVEDGPSNPVDPNEEFSFTVNIRGTATVHGQPNAVDIDSETGSYGEMEFHSDGQSTTTATFTLKPGESITAVNLSEGLDYEVIENLTPDQEARFAALPATRYSKIKGIGENKGRRDIDPYTSVVTFTNVLPVCKITDNNGNLLYRRYIYNTGSTELEYNVPAVYTELTGDDGALKALEGPLYVSSSISSPSYSVANNIQIQMVVPEYTLPVAADLPSSVNGAVTLSTAASDASQFPYQGAGTASTVKRGFGDASMFTVHGDLSLADIVLDGGKSSRYEASANGGIMNVPAGGQLSIKDGATLQNSRTTAKGGAVHVANGGVVSMSGGAVQRNESVDDGAGIYLEPGSTLNLSGNPSFGGTGLDVGGNIVVRNGNYKDGSLIGKTNGKKTYGRARQDIFVAEAHEGAPSSLVVAGDLTGAEGSIWVWAASDYHYKTLLPFAKIGENASITSANNLTVFRNAQDDDATENPTDTFLYGTTIGDVPGYVYWSGITDFGKVILRKVDSAGNPIPDATFTIHRSRDASSAAVAVNGLSIFTSDINGTVLVGELPYGEYYMHESSPQDRWFFITVGDDGVVCMDS